MNVRFMEITLPEVKEFPLWSRSVAISDDGTIFVPGDLAGNEEMVCLCAFDDGVHVITYLDHMFFPLEWLSREFPQAKQACDFIESESPQLH